MAHLIVHEDAECSAIGTRAAKRFQAGRFRFVEVLIRQRTEMRAYMERSFWGKQYAKLLISANAFSGANLAEAIAHEEAHLDYWVGPLHYLGDDTVWQTGSRCGR
jgi:hypothetical protein